MAVEGGRGYKCLFVDHAALGPDQVSVLNPPPPFFFFISFTCSLPSQQVVSIWPLFLYMIYIQFDCDFALFQRLFKKNSEAEEDI